MKMDKAWFIQSRQGNIKDHYFFEKKLGSGGYGAVYLAKHKLTGKLLFSKASDCKKTSSAMCRLASGSKSNAKG
jgi:serine/threonine protein kinase